MRCELSVQFEFDSWKSESNKAKHGINFVEAQALWRSKIVLLPAKDVWRDDTWSLGELAPTIGLRLSPIGERQFGLLV
jgi:uncharacterized DUF497 family protein